MGQKPRAKNPGLIANFSEKT